MRIHAPAWHRDAACATHPDPDLWTSTSRARVEEARAICARCPVREECELDGAGMRHGVWGGVVRHAVK